jgi:DNA-directed RNA polymerase sigma subunit (sigma70/sigma32)
VTTAPRKIQYVPVKDVDSKRRGPTPASRNPPNNNLSLAIDRTDDPAEMSDPVEQVDDFVWDEEESAALRQARKDAELTPSADSVRAYLKQIGKVALLNAEQEVDLAKRIEAGLYAAERIH